MKVTTRNKLFAENIAIIKRFIPLTEDGDDMENTKSMGGYKRLESIDIIKGILILLVVFAHAQPGKMLHRFIYLFHMPVFFMITGYLWNDKNIAGLSDVSRFIVRKLKSLYLPFVIFNGFLWTLEFLMGNLSTKGYLVSMGKVVLFQGRHQLSDTTWYLNVLFFSSLIYAAMNLAVLRKHLLQKKRFLILTITALLFLIAGNILSYKGINRMMIGTVLTGVFLLHFGKVLRNFQSQFAWLKKPQAMITGLLILIICYFASGEEIRLINNFYISGLYLICTCIGGWLFIYGISMLLLKAGTLKRLLVAFGQSSLYILGIHMACFRLVNILHVLLDRGGFELVKSYPVYKSDGVWYIVYAGVGIAVPYAIYKLQQMIPLGSRRR